MFIRTVRFRVHEGHLVPLEPIVLVEGTEVHVAIQVVEPDIESKIRPRPENFMVRDLGLKSRTVTREDAYDDGL